MLKNVVVPKKEWDPELYQILRDLQKQTQQAAGAVAAIGRGEEPDGSGNPLPTLGNFWFLPGRPNNQLAFGGTGAGGTATISSTRNDAKGFIYFGDPDIRVAIDETEGLVGINVAAPQASLHLQPGGSGTVTLVPSSDIGGVTWDGPRNAAQAFVGGPMWDAVDSNDGSTSWGGHSDVPLGASTQEFGLDGIVALDKVWTITLSLSILSGTVVTGTVTFELRDSNGDSFTYVPTVNLVGLTGYPSFTTYTFTLDCTGTPSSTGSTPNSCRVGLQCTNPVNGYIACSYVAVERGGDSDIARWNNSSATLLGKINSTGQIGIGTGSSTLSAMLTVIPSSAATVGQIIKGATSQSANLLEFRNSANTLLSRVTSAGVWDGPINTTAPAQFTDASFRVVDETDPTKTFAFSLGGALTGVDLVLAFAGTADRTLTLPDVTSTLAALGLAQSFTAKQTFTVAPQIDIASAATNFVWTATDNDGNGIWAASAGGTSFADNVFDVHDDGDTTKKVVFSLGGAATASTLTLISAHTTNRSITFPDVTGTLPTLENTHTVTGAWTFNPTTSGTNDLTFVPVVGGGGGAGTGITRFLDAASGFHIELAIVSAGLTANRLFELPDASIVPIGTSNTVTISNKTMAASTHLISSTAATGVDFMDTTTNTKKLRMILSGAFAGNNTFTFTGSGQAKNYGFGNLSGNLPIIGDDPPAVAAGALGKVDLTGQTAAIGSTNLSNTPPAGLYRVDVYVACTTVSGSGAPTLDVNIAWTDVVGATNRNCTAEPGSTAFPLSLAATGRASASMFVQVASGNIAYTTTINAASGSPQYAIYIRVTYLG